MLLRPPSDPELFDQRRAARFLYWMGWPCEDIGDYLKVPAATVRSWKRRDDWDDAPAIQRLEASLEARLGALIVKEVKSGSDFKEIDLLFRQLERLARVNRYNAGGNAVDLNPKLAARNAGEKKQPKRNHFTPEQVEQLGAAFRDGLYHHQRIWLDSSSMRTRLILKSRQIGATIYFAWEALIRAIETGNNQIFLSASKAQALHFRQYIIDFAWKHTGVRLQGDPIVIERGEGEEAVTLYFLGTNFRTAQGYHGDFVFDEYFWVHGFDQIKKVASAIATQKRYRKTYCSTPSSVGHEAYAFWTGEAQNRGKAKAEKLRIDVSHGALKAGRLCEDGIFRHIVTLQDAIDGGFNLIDLEEIRREHSPEEFDNLFDCQFIDDALSMFPMAQLLRCAVEAYDEWEDFDFYEALAGRRPYGHNPVWVGYDPSDTGDSAGLVVVAPPAQPGGKFRLLERLQFRGLDFEQQARRIEEICGRYNVTYLAVDATGAGSAVAQLVRVFYPGVVALQYDVALKTTMVLKAQNVIRNRRLELDAGMTDVMRALVSIRKTLTASGKGVTYEAPRTKDGSHADLAWALLHCLMNEPLEAAIGGSTGASVEIFG